ncbi:ABC transporter substrate-binding protein [Spiroplasma endosymbiont of Othius punctulatus]|uniref:ABC transporter substrate-binding protein n=1 Tax=Spiroplasma endosymbiont of Othius punctulatus TaxID=3066289 RepID=UPI0030D36A6B
MKKLISLFFVLTIMTPSALLIISCGGQPNDNVEVWIESSPNSTSLIGYIDAAKYFNAKSENEIKVEIKNISKGNMERELLSNKYAPDIINGSLDRAFRVQQIRSEKIMSIEFDETKAFDKSFLEFGQDKDDNQLMVPIGKSFSVLLINKKLLREIGYKFSEDGEELVNKIWDKRFEIIKELDKSKKKFLGIDDMSDLINLQFAKENKISTSEMNPDYFFNYYDDILNINKKAANTFDPLMQELNNIRDSLIVTSNNTRPSGAFKNNSLLMSTASSAGLKYYNSWDKGWDNDIGIINIPSTKNFMVQRGDGLIALESGNSNKEKVAEDFINYLVDSDEIWEPTSATGYIPWTKKGIENIKFKEDSPEDEVLKMVKGQTKNQFSIESNESSGLYNQFIFNEMVVNILLSDSGWDIEKLFDGDAKAAYTNASKSREIIVNEN